MSIRNKIQGLRQIMHFDNCMQLVLDRVFFTRTNLSVHRLGDIECLVNYRGGDVNGLRYCLIAGPYRGIVQTLPLEKRTSFLDFGANCGGFPLLLRAMEFDLQIFACVKFNPRTFVRLQFNVKHNIEGSAMLLNAALCGKRQEFAVRQTLGGTGDNIYAARTKGAAASDRVIKGMLFDDVFDLVWPGADGVADLCKIHLEGTDYEVFFNSGHDRLQRCRFLIIEIHQPPAAGDREALFAETPASGSSRCVRKRPTTSMSSRMNAWAPTHNRVADAGAAATTPRNRAHRLPECKSLPNPFPCIHGSNPA